MENKLKDLREKLQNSTIALLKTIRGDDDEDTTNQTGIDNERIPLHGGNIRRVPDVEIDW